MQEKFGENRLEEKEKESSISSIRRPSGTVKAFLIGKVWKLLLMGFWVDLGLSMKLISTVAKLFYKPFCLIDFLTPEKINILLLLIVDGIERITKNLLIRYFNEVDLLEPVSHFLDAARESLAPENHVFSDMHKAVNFFWVPLQEFTPDTGKYDVIWVQWCIGHLADDDFVSFFKRAKVGLKPGGLFVLKENIAWTGFVLDKQDRSITRSDFYLKELFSRCGLHVYKSKDQKGLPEELFAVKMYALTTEMPKRVHKTRSKVQANRPCIIK
ncbi:hypothetical protein LWI28_012936 [Acer negundo]|uniref:Alpha N-terminal protein methyltransferase 1 n=1 Tax=Acer negundo TaxID=4023 RepID=A0AAD5JGF1_ACENE|nr:hypothetical protein LWI28_012936 [Acer negundo]